MFVHVVPSGDDHRPPWDEASHRSPFHSSPVIVELTAPTLDHVNPSRDRAKPVTPFCDPPPAIQWLPFQRMRVGRMYDPLAAQMSPPTYQVLASNEYA